MKLNEMTICEMLNGLSAREFSATELADDVINQVNKKKKLGALIEFNEEQYRDHAKVSDERRNKNQVGKLDGIPLVLKDNIDTKDFATTGATGALAGKIPNKDAPAVNSLRGEGAIIAAKAVLHELAFGITCNNAVTGPAQNPYNPSLIPGGSSGGTAVAVSSRQFPAGLGTDTGGSVRIPSALCGLFGFRPSVGRYSGKGIIPISSTRDTIGPIAKSMDDILLLDTAMAVKTVPSIKSTELKDIRIGLPKTRLWEDLEPGVQKLSLNFLKELKINGVEIVEKDFPEIWELNENTGFPIALFEVMQELPAYLENSGYGISLAELVEGIGSPDVLGIISSQMGEEAMPEEVYSAAIQQHRPKMKEIYANYFRDEKINGIIFPTTPLTARPIGHDETVDLNGNQQPTFPTFIRNTDLGSNLGAPGISMPIGISGGLPVGIEVDGLPGEDNQLLSMALSLEKLLPPTPAP
ncbi:MAG: indoleacetamide hydrolase [Pseudomonadota bacterium]|nr:indoleacetamide hydrolase [Pseudomonadota bacterium]